jgi:hypothetical protein
MKVKKIATLLLAVGIAFSFSGCSDAANMQRVNVGYAICSTSYNCNNTPVLFILPEGHGLLSIDLLGAKGGAFMGSMADAMPHVPTGLGAYDSLPWEEIAGIIGDVSGIFTEDVVRSQGGVIVTKLIPDPDESDGWYKFSRLISGFVPVKYACEFYGYDNNRITSIEIPVGTTSILMIPEIAAIKVTSVIDFDPNLEYSKGTIGGKIAYDMAYEVQDVSDIPAAPNAGVSSESETDVPPITSSEPASGTIEITSVSPSNAMLGVETVFSVTVKYASTNAQGCIIYAGANTNTANRYTLYDEYELPDTSGIYTFNFKCVPAKWDGYDFGIYVNISEYPHPDSWNPFAADVYPISLSSGGSTSGFNLVGMWKASDGSIITFNNDGTFTFEWNLGFAGGLEEEGTYSVDSTAGDSFPITMNGTSLISLMQMMYGTADSSYHFEILKKDNNNISLVQVYGSYTASSSPCKLPLSRQ